MTTFEQLLVKEEADLAQLVAPPGGRSGSAREPGARLDGLARGLNLTPAQLVCAFGFNRHAGLVENVVRALGFASYDELCSHRNYLFINDIYQQLALDDVLDVYQALAGSGDPPDAVTDLIYSRLAELETRVEGTSNPELVGSYKLEVRAIYELGLIEREFVETRLTSPYVRLRALTHEIDLVAQQSLVPVESLIARLSVTPEEKRSLLALGLVPTALIRARLRHPRITAHEREVLQAALDDLD